MSTFCIGVGGRA